MALTNKALEQELLNDMKKLEIRIDYIGPTPLRHRLSDQVTIMRSTLVNFDQIKYEGEL